MEKTRHASLLATKLYIPPTRHSLVERQRLLTQLDNGLSCNLTLVSAPAGFGKTTLLSSWITSRRSRAKTSRTGNPQFTVRDLRFCWLSLDEHDNDPVRFCSYLAAALRTAQPAEGEAEELLYDSLPVGAPILSNQTQWLETMLITLINDLAGQNGASDSHLVLILDDYHTITTPSIHSSVTFLLNHLPPQVHVIILTRVDPPLPLARLRARNHLTEIRAADLRFTPEETAAFLNQTMKLDLSEKDVSALETRTEGWITALQLAALSMYKKKDTAAFIAAFDGTHRYVMDYLLEEVLQRQPREVREFLVQTAILDRLTPSLCNALTGRDDGQEMLKSIEQTNLFLVPLDDRREQYRYHHLFGDFLRTQVKATHRAELHRRAAQWYAAEDLDGVVEHALASGDIDLSKRMIGRSASKALRRGLLNTLFGWFDALPDDDVRSDSLLAGYKAWALELTSRLDEAESYLAAAESHLPTDAPDGLVAFLATVRAYVARDRGDMAGVIAASKQALRLADVIAPSLHCSILHILAVAQFATGEVEPAAQSFLHSFEIGRESHTYFGGVMSLARYAWLRLEQGHRRHVVRLCEKTLREWVGPRGRPLPLAGYAHLFLGQACYQSNQLKDARQHLLTSLDLIAKVPYQEYILWGNVLLARVYRALDDQESASVATHKAYETAADSQWWRNIVRAFLMDPDPRRGDLAAAVPRLETEGFSPYDTPQPRRRFFYVIYARALLAVERTRDALTVLASLERLIRQPNGLSAQHIGNVFDVTTEILILQAMAYQALGEDVEATVRMERALRRAAPQDSRRVYLEAGPAVVAPIRRARRAAPAFADQLLANLNAERSTLAQPLTEPLTTREIEVLGLIATGLRNKEIASQLCLSVGTVKRHISNINGKMGTNNRTQAVARARGLGIL